MAKLEKLSDEMQERVSAVVRDFTINQFATVEAMCALKQKVPVAVSRANAATEFLTDKPDTILVFINEPIMEKLDFEQQDMLIRDALSGVYLDSEKERMVVNKPEISVSMWGHRKYGDKIINAFEAFVLANQQAEEEEKERKKAQKEAKMNKQNQ